MWYNTEEGAGRGPRRRHEPDLETVSRLSGRITALRPQQRDPHRCSLYLDGRYVMSLHEESILLTHLKEGMEVDGAQLAEALRQDLIKRAWDYALRLLSASARTRRQVAQRLQRRYPPEVAEQVLERLTAAGWLDDEAYARHYVEVHRGFGAARLLRELTRRGVSPDLARQVVAEALEGEDLVIRAREAAAQRLKRTPGLDRETAQRRLAGYLARRGYDFATIAEALAPLLQDLPRAPRPRRLSGRLRGGMAPEEEAEST